MHKVMYKTLTHSYLNLYHIRLMNENQCLPPATEVRKER